MRRSLFLAGFALISAFCGGVARGEETTPAFSMPGLITPDDVAALSVDFDESFSAIENQYLADTLKLNYQISLLEKMVARQAELEKISESYAAMGVHYDPPAPARGICAQLPANAPCLKAYPDLYPAVVDSRKEFYQELERKARAAAEPERKEGESDKQLEERKKTEAAEKKRIADMKERDDRYRWTDVSCLGGQCRGVLVTHAMDGFRATVREGDTLPDGTKVQTISTRGIRVSIDGQAVNVRPAPGEKENENERDNAGAALPLKNALTGVNGAGNANNISPNPGTAAAQAAAGLIANATKPSGSAGPSLAVTGASASAGDGKSANSSGGGGGQTTVEPALGPSGLF